MNTHIRTRGNVNVHRLRKGRLLRRLIYMEVETRLHNTRRETNHRTTGSPTAVDITMMRRAIELARKAAAIGEVPIGAVLHRNGQIIAEAHNLVETIHDATGHAELRAVRLASERLHERRLNDCTLVVTLEPCTMCAGGIVLSRVGRLVFGASDPKAGAIHSVYHICSDKRLNHRPEICGGVLADECGSLLSEFFRERRKMNKARKAAGITKSSPRRRAAS